MQNSGGEEWRVEEGSAAFLGYKFAFLKTLNRCMGSLELSHVA